MKKSSLYQSTIRHINTSINTNSLELRDSILPLASSVKEEQTTQNEFQCKDYIPSKTRKKLCKL